MIRKISATLAAALLALGAGVAVPAQSTPEAATGTAGVQYEQWKMGGRPASSTICVANGIAGLNVGFVFDQLERADSSLSIVTENRCDGYSITNRMTVDDASWSGTSCAQFLNTGRVYDSVQGKYIWNQNVVIRYNTSDYCWGTETAKRHRLAMFMEYILGASYEVNAPCLGTIGSYPSCINTWRDPQQHDRDIMRVIYGAAA